MTQLQVPQSIDVLQAIRPRRRSDDIFFIDGDRLALQSSDAIAISYIEERYDDEEGVTNNNKRNDTATTSNNHHYENEQGRQQRERPRPCFPCSSPHCNEVFDTIAESQRHYEEKHCFQCIECNSVYPNEYLLDLHIEETHDAYFQLSLERQKKQQHDQGCSMTNGEGCYKCLVIGCQSTFRSDKERCYHLRHVHEYPNWFRFHSRRKKKFPAMSEKVSLCKSKQWWHNKRKNFSNSSPNENDYGRSNENEDETMVPVENIIQDNKDEAKHQKLKSKMRERKERKKKANASIPCRFYNSKGGCWRGENCMFLHVSSATNSLQTKGNVAKFKIKPSSDENKSDHDTDHNTELSDCMDICEEIDSLATQMKTKAKISVPSNISFGRRRRNY